jgi:hypothetical protein
MLRGKIKVWEAKETKKAI